MHKGLNRLKFHLNDPRPEIACPLHMLKLKTKQTSGTVCHLINHSVSQSCHKNLNSAAVFCVDTPLFVLAQLQPWTLLRCAQYCTLCSSTKPCAELHSLDRQLSYLCQTISDVMTSPAVLPGNIDVSKYTGQRSNSISISLTFLDWKESWKSILALFSVTVQVNGWCYQNMQKKKHLCLK